MFTKIKKFRVYHALLVVGFLNLILSPVKPYAQALTLRQSKELQEIKVDGLLSPVQNSCQSVCQTTYNACILGAGGDPDIQAICEVQRVACETNCPAQPPLNFSGFFQPVDMGGVWNTVKGGSTVPLKFEVFDGSIELTDPAIVVQPLTATQTLCSGGSTDDIELTSTGATSLRYENGSGQFVYNWQTPNKPGYCYVVTVNLTDGSIISSNFKLK